MAGNNDNSSNQGYFSKELYGGFFLSSLYYHVIRFNMKYVWGCPLNEVLLPFFIDHFSTRHLDCGVADGYFCAAALSAKKSDSAGAAGTGVRLVLLDHSAGSLASAQATVHAAAPAAEIQCVAADIRAPLPTELQGAQFDSISMFNLFHCVAGGRAKWDAAFGTYGSLLADGGVLSGCSVLGHRHAKRWPGWYALWFYNCGSSRAFNNWDDTQEDVEEALRREFTEVETRLVGMVLLWTARKPRRGNSVET